MTFYSVNFIFLCELKIFGIFEVSIWKIVRNQRKVLTDWHPILEWSERVTKTVKFPQTLTEVQLYHKQGNKLLRFVLKSFLIFTSQKYKPLKVPFSNNRGFSDISVILLEFCLIKDLIFRLQILILLIYVKGYGEYEICYQFC